MSHLKQLTLVSLFSGAGGLDIGLEQAGFRTIAATDFDHDCVSTLLASQQAEIPVEGHLGRSYLQGARIVEADISQISARELVPANTKVDLLVGGPPCQPFSSAGKQQSVLDSRGRLFEHFVRLAEQIQPRAILFENVRGLVTSRGARGEPGEVLMDVRAQFENLGYATSIGVLNSADYGSPQRRVRLFIIAFRDRRLPEFPQPTHARNPLSTLLDRQSPWVTLAAFLRKSPKPRADEIVAPSKKLGPLLESLPEGSGLISKGRAEPTRPGGHWGYKQGTFIADLELPARTVTGASSQDWIRTPSGQLRRLTLRECAGLQGFPVQWQFCGSKVSQFKQVGNAVPSIFGKVLGDCLNEALGAAPQSKPVSADLPASVTAAIQYTKKDHARNAPARYRTNEMLRLAKSGKVVSERCTLTYRVACAANNSRAGRSASQKTSPQSSFSTCTASDAPNAAR